ncbi:SURF1 family protein [Altererythrobacter sp. CC-YST694]|uniref:SURF1 family protein n=1 Tax=Altererythrobacter sp. CC-YST694 TaxID=2755038 RepID=UPI001D00F9B4|nr:SURF1 family protein [Altererythrobacter sp. CC-YST694]MCB5426452.1 SURF1 family protein [Altererythrobacter sp. CC-YST694]
MAAGKARPYAFIVALAVVALVCLPLGLWQVQRLAWKEALIARTEAAMRAPPLAVRAVPRGDASRFEYRRIRLQGQYDPRGAVLVTGTSSLGSGYWMLVPLRGASGAVVYVNRGFLPMRTTLDAARGTLPAGQVTVTGLLRLTEPGGTWLRANKPDQGRWYSRDIAAIAALSGASAETRFFIDAQVESPAMKGAPVPGLTVISFPNNHLGYALTWFALALLSCGAAIMLWRRSS